MENKKPLASKLPIIALIAILAGSFLLMRLSSVKESATMDELAHIPSGYAYVAKGDYRLNPEHPPLVKIISAIPLVIKGFNFPTNIKAWTDDINGQWDMGTAFLYQSGNDADKLIQLARIGPMLLTLVLILIVYLWSKKMMGGKWALIPAAITAFSPNLLAHGHYVTTDIGAAVGVIGATFFFIKSLEKPTKKNLIFAGIFFGIAQLLKFSMFLLVPYFMVLAAIWGINQIIKDEGDSKFRAFFSQVWLQLKNLIAVFAVGYLLIYPVYFFTTMNYPIDRQVSDTKAILNSVSGGPDAAACSKLKMRCLSELTILAAGNPITRPYAEYSLGFIMVTQRASGGNTGYFMGEVSNKGWKSYFPIVYATKEPIPVLLMAIIGIIISIIAIFKKPLKALKGIPDYIKEHMSEVAMILFIILYAYVSISSPLNIGIRHLMPIIPLVYILSVQAIKRADTKWIKTGMIVLLAWFGIESAIAAPNYISYYNEFGGGKWSGYMIATDSNYDWGQDLLRLKSFVEDNKIEKIAVDYFGGGNPTYYLGDKNERWWSSKGNPAEQGIKWAAISINTIQQAKARKDETIDNNKVEDNYPWITDPYNPYARIGTSIFVYKLK